MASPSDEDVALLDRCAKATGLPSRSAAVQKAIGRLADPALEDAYATAWDEWEAAGDAEVWEGIAGDGLVDAAR